MMSLQLPDDLPNPIYVYKDIYKGDRRKIEELIDPRKKQKSYLIIPYTLYI